MYIAYFRMSETLPLTSGFLNILLPVLASVIRTEVGADVMLILQTGQSEVFTDTLLVSVGIDVSRSAAFLL